MRFRRWIRDKILKTSGINSIESKQQENNLLRKLKTFDEKCSKVKWHENKSLKNKVQKRKCWILKEIKDTKNMLRLWIL